jgi:uncharacterized protein YacL (UPF0231 family)
MAGYVADYIKDRAEESERILEAVEEIKAWEEWREREGENIPAWMDEEEITSREYEGDYEQESGPRIKAW